MMTETVHDDYPGIEVSPPPGTVQMGQTEGEWNVKWKKIGDRFTITEIDGVQVEHDSQPNSKVISSREEDPPESARDELHRLSAMADY